MFTALRRNVVVAVALCAALSSGFCTGIVSAQESPVSATSVAIDSQSPFVNGEQFGQIVQQNSPSQTPEQWIRGRLAGKFAIPECPRYWTMLDPTGAEYYDAAFGTWGSPWGSVDKLRAYAGGLVEVHLIKDMHCMNTPAGEFTWRLASIEPLGTTQGRWQVFLPLVMRNHAVYNVDRYSGWVDIMIASSQSWNWVLRNGCKQVIYVLQNPVPEWYGKWVSFNATRITRPGLEDLLVWDGNVNTVSVSEQGQPCWWTSTPTPTARIPDPTNTATPILHADAWGWLRKADPRECAHAYVETCLGGSASRIPLWHRNGPSFFDGYYEQEVHVGGVPGSPCGGMTVEGIGRVPGFCPVNPTATPTRTATATATATLAPNEVRTWVIFDPSGNSCGNAQMWTDCWTRQYGWITNAPREWNGRYVSFRLSDIGDCPGTSLAKVTWDGNGSTVTFPNAPQCATPTFTPTATAPGNPTWTPTATFTSTPTATRTNTPVPPPTTPPTAVPGSFTAYLLTVRPGDDLGECGRVYAILCGGEIAKIQNAPAFEEGKSYSFNATWLAECRHDDHGHRILQVTSALMPTSCPANSLVNVPEFKPCDPPPNPFCWGYKITEMAGLPPLVLLLPYPRLNAPAIPE